MTVFFWVLVPLSCFFGGRMLVEWRNSRLSFSEWYGKQEKDVQGALVALPLSGGVGAFVLLADGVHRADLVALTVSIVALGGPLLHDRTKSPPVGGPSLRLSRAQEGGASAVRPLAARDATIFDKHYPSPVPATSNSRGGVVPPKTFKPGAYSVVITGVKPPSWHMDESVTVSGVEAILRATAARDKESIRTLIERAIHISPQPVVEGIAQEDAIRLKKALEGAHAKVRIVEGSPASAVVQSPGREPIPERVRHEVWRRDQGACVVCGCREKLEFDHIIPVSKGGSNTARNIELRCESCNRQKAAKI